jgi:hypothetical protein
MHDLPGAIFGPKDRRNPKSKGSDVFPLAYLALGLLYPHNISKLWSHILGYRLEASDLAISDERFRGMLQDLSYLLPSTYGRAKGISESYVFLMRPQVLPRFRVSIEELA